MGTEIIRERGNKSYLYYAYYDDKERKEVYCGVAAEFKSKQKARECEINELQAQKEKITLKIKELKSC